MKQATVFAILLVAIGWSICSTKAFIPSKIFTGSSIFLYVFRKYPHIPVVTHWDMTRNAVLEVAAEVLKDNPNPSDRALSVSLLYHQVLTKGISSLPIMAAVMTTGYLERKNLSMQSRLCGRQLLMLIFHQKKP